MSGFTSLNQPRRRLAADRFWASVDRSGGPGACWLWLRARDRDGYGIFHADGRAYRAHRYSLALHGRQIPAGLVPDHLCRTRHCVNPGHLEVVSVWTNTMRGETPAAANAAKTHCPQGHAYDELNTLKSPARGRKRLCRACNRARCARYYQRRHVRLDVEGTGLGA